MSTDTITQVPLDRLAESPMNTRRMRDSVLDDQLASSIKVRGILAPLLVRKNGKDFEILAGSRRFRAAKKIKLQVVPVKVIEADDATALELIIIENIQRQDVHPLDQADGYIELLEKSNWDYAGVAGKVNKTRQYVAQRAKMANLSKSWRKEWEKQGPLFTIEHAVQLSRLDGDTQEEIYRKLDNFPDVGQLRKTIDEWFMLNLKRAPWDLADAKLLESAGSCVKCPKRTGSNKDLFGDLKQNICTDRACFMLKAIAHGKSKAKVGQEVHCLSPEYDKRRAAKGTLAGEQYTEIANGKVCEKTAIGVVTAVYAHNFGQSIKVCLGGNSCPVHRDQHGGGMGGGKPTKKQRAKKIDANKKARRQLEENNVTLDHVMKTWKLDLENTRIITRTFWERLWGDSKATICMRRGWIQKRSGLFSGGPKGMGFDFADILKEMSTVDCHAFMLEASVVSELGRQGDPKLGPTIRDLAKRCKVNPEKVKADVDFAEGRRATERSARNKQAAADRKKTKGKGSKKKTKVGKK